MPGLETPERSLYGRLGWVRARPPQSPDHPDPRDVTYFAAGSLQFLLVGDPKSNAQRLYKRMAGGGRHRCRGGGL